MKRLYISLATLAALLLLGWLSLASLTESTNSMRQELLNSQGAADISQAENFILSAQKIWEADKPLYSLFLRDGTLCEIDILFTSTLVTCRNGQSGEFQLHSSVLIDELKRLVESEIPTLSNIS